MSGGRLRAQIDAAAEAHGIGIGDLTVLAPRNDPYRWDTPLGHRYAAWFAEWLAKLVPNGTVHLRGFHYKLCASAAVIKPDGLLYINSDEDWRWLTTKASKAARWNGYVPHERIRDERNEPPYISIEEHADFAGHGGVSCGYIGDPPPLPSSEPHVYCFTPEFRQPYRIILIGEKSSLKDALSLIPRSELLLPTGEMSDTMIGEMAARAAEDGRPAAAFYFSDFDPSGWQMPISVSRKLQAFCTLRHPELQIELHRVALSAAQVRRYGLLSTPLKEGELRAEQWRAVMGHEQTEVDALLALHPGALTEIARNAVAPFFDRTLARRAEELRSQWQREAEQRLRDSPGYAEACRIIKTTNDSLSEALNQAWVSARETHERAELLLPPIRTTLSPPDPIIDTDQQPEPLFSSASDFATASRKLIAEKRLDGVES
jgi:hypothetical protein